MGAQEGWLRQQKAEGGAESRSSTEFTLTGYGEVSTPRPVDSLMVCSWLGSWLLPEWMIRQRGRGGEGKGKGERKEVKTDRQSERIRETKRWTDMDKEIVNLVLLRASS